MEPCPHRWKYLFSLKNIYEFSVACLLELWTDGNIDVYPQCTGPCLVKKAANERKHRISPMKHGGGGLMIWFCSYRSWHFVVTELALNKSLHQIRVKCETICPAAEVWTDWAMKQHNNPKLQKERHSFFFMWSW